MKRRRLVRLIIAGIAVVAALFVWDLAIETDTERLEPLAEAHAGTVEWARLEAERARWVDLSVQPFEVSAFSTPQIFEEGDDEALVAYAQRGVQALVGTTVRVLSTHIEVEADRATVDVQVFTDRGILTARWSLRKHGDRWLAERLHVERG